MANPRYLAAKLLNEIEKDNKYSNIAVKSALENNDLDAKDKAFFSALVYGTLDRKITIDYLIRKQIKVPIKKISPFTLAVLRTAVYQIFFMEKVPESAAVNEAVKLVKKSKENRNSGFTNAVLHSVIREGLNFPEDDSIKNLSIKFSCPEWIIESFINDYGFETAKLLLSESLKTPPLSLKINTVKIDSESFLKELKKENISFEFDKQNNSVIIDGGMDIANNELYKKGYFYAQDKASGNAIKALNPKPHSRVLDMCASPGGKSFTAANLMENKGEIISCDLYEQRVGLIKKTAAHLGLDIINPKVADATVFDENLGKFDFIICDVPCSGLGVIRRKPELKYKEQTDFSELESIQYKILSCAAKYLKEDGKILYSTCTLRKGENENLVNSFLKEYNEFQKVYEHTFMPHIDKTDGFYCALISR